MSTVKRLEDELKDNPQLRLDDVRALREWANNQPHLPNIDDRPKLKKSLIPKLVFIETIPDVYLAIFLTRRYYDLEKAKQTLDNYLTFGTVVPEMSVNRSLRRAGFYTFFDTHYIVSFDQRDAEGHIVVLVYLHDPDPRKYDLPPFLKAGRTILDAWFLENGGAKGQTVIMDQRNLSLSCIMKVTLSALRNVVYFNKDCAPVSLKRIYMINASKLVNKMVNFFKPVIKADIFHRIKIFTPSQMDEFYKLVPQERMPNEYGGNAGSLQELTKRTMDQIQRHEQLFDKLDRLKVDESKRPPQRKKSLKRLEID